MSRLRTVDMSRIQLSASILMCFLPVHPQILAFTPDITEEIVPKRWMVKTKRLESAPSER